MRKLIKNVVNYDILSNPRYADMFYYNHIDERANSIHISSDIVAQMVYAGEDTTVELKTDDISTAL